MIYFDSTATTKPLKEVLDSYSKINEDYWYNPSGLNKASVTSKILIDKATSNIFDVLGLQNKKIIYTSGATEANNEAILGICLPYINQGKHIITSYIEHPSVYNVFERLKKLGFNVTYISCKNGAIDLDELKSAITKDTILVSTMWVNNIIGSINDIKSIIDIVKPTRAKLHVDMVQGFTKLIPDFDYNDIDLFTITAHKIEGLKGIGALIYSNNISLTPILKGGHQQEEIRPGTMDPALIVSFSKAIRLASKDIKTHLEYVTKLYNHLYDGLSKFNHIKINKTFSTTKPIAYSPYLISISFNNIKGETAMHDLESNDIIVGIGSACNEKTETIERAIEAISSSKTRAINMIRISLSYHNTIDEIDKLINNIERIGNN